MDLKLDQPFPSGMRNDENDNGSCVAQPLIIDIVKNIKVEENFEDEEEKMIDMGDFMSENNQEALNMKDPLDISVKDEIKTENLNDGVEEKLESVEGHHFSYGLIKVEESNPKYEQVIQEDVIEKYVAGNAHSCCDDPEKTCVIDKYDLSNCRENHTNLNDKQFSVRVDNVTSDIVDKIDLGKPVCSNIEGSEAIAASSNNVRCSEINLRLGKELDTPVQSPDDKVIVKNGYLRKSSKLLNDLNIQKRTRTGRKRFVCDICEKSFARPYGLKEHKRIHDGDKPFVCDVCEISFTRSSYLTTHKQTHTGERPHVCDVCEKSFFRVGDLNVHKRTHTGEKPFVCDICGKSFTKLDTLVRHKRIHTGEKPFACDFCDKSFAYLNVLKMHKQTHTRQKSFVCDICEKSFNCEGYLNVHKHSHEEKKLLICDVCEKPFPRLSHFKRHMRTHTGEKPYVCNVCVKSFSQLSSLKKHMEIHTR